MIALTAGSRYAKPSAAYRTASKIVRSGIGESAKSEFATSASENFSLAAELRKAEQQRDPRYGSKAYDLEYAQKHLLATTTASNEANQSVSLKAVLPEGRALALALVSHNPKMASHILLTQSAMIADQRVSALQSSILREQQLQILQALQSKIHSDPESTHEVFLTPPNADRADQHLASNLLLRTVFSALGSDHRNIGVTHVIPPRQSAEPPLDRQALRVVSADQKIAIICSAPYHARVPAVLERLAHSSQNASFYAEKLDLNSDSKAALSPGRRGIINFDVTSAPDHVAARINGMEYRVRRAADARVLSVKADS